VKPLFVAASVNLIHECIQRISFKSFIKSTYKSIYHLPIYLFIVLFRVFLYRPGWHPTHNLPASASPVLHEYHTWLLCEGFLIYYLKTLNINNNKTHQKSAMGKAEPAAWELLLTRNPVQSLLMVVWSSIFYINSSIIFSEFLLDISMQL
jgi:hypothetical protein